MNSWQPSASLELIKLRAETIRRIREFFYKNDILEVDTPILSCATVPDPFIESFQTQYLPLTQVMSTQAFYLHTSPEFPMKRLLASGSGSIFQISKVFRQGESGRKHNPEFTLLEWYRDGWDHQQLMAEVDQLLTQLLATKLDLGTTCFVTYEEAFQERLGINPHCVSKQELLACTEQVGLANVLQDNEENDRFLELLFSHIIEPELGKVISEGIDKKSRPCICFLYHYPASQASLARLGESKGQKVAERFEVFIDGMELANGFHELNDAREQRCRFENDNKNRIQAGLSEIPMDEHFLTALEHLPDCAGVALGIERLLMIMSQASHIDEVIAFPFARA